MPYTTITVTAYAGHRVNERPVSFVLNGEAVTVVKILDRWIEESYSDRVRKRFFIVRADNDARYKIYIDERTAEWFCEVG